MKEPCPKCNTKGYYVKPYSFGPYYDPSQIVKCDVCDGSGYCEFVMTPVDRS